MRSTLERATAFAMDAAMCGVMNSIQLRRRHDCTHAELEAYLATCNGISREEYYQIPEPAKPQLKDEWLEWKAPFSSGFTENDRPRVRMSFCKKGPSAPTVMILHALMSASDVGYRRLATWFNERGWNAAFPHLPYHYSRKPKGYLNGELAITANLVRNVETLRLGVVELRQLMQWLRSQGGAEFAVLGTSYGGWTGALLSFMEPDLRFLALIQPIVNTDSAIWENPTAAALRLSLKINGIQRSHTRTHFHLSSPSHGVPLCGPDRVIITAGKYDTVSPIRYLRVLHETWKGSRFIEVPQGHFGYSALRETLKLVEPLLEPESLAG